jgi:ClpP class serine protease
LDVWGFLSLIGEAALRLWNEALAAAGPVQPRLVIAVVCIGLALVLALAAFASRKSRRGSSRQSSDEAFFAQGSSSSGRLWAGPPLQSDAGTRALIAKLEAERGSRVIAIIHRENMERAYLDIADLEDALTAIRMTPKDKPLDVVVHSPGGHLLVGQQIARAVKAHPAKTTVFVPYFARGASTLIAFAADEIVMSAHAALSPIDPYTGIGSASSVLKAIAGKPIAKVDDETVICADVARKMMDEAKRVTCELMHSKHDHNGACHLADELVSGKFSYDRAITASAAKEAGLNVNLKMSATVYDLIRSCRRGDMVEASVSYLDEVQPAGAASLRERVRHAPAIGAFDYAIAPTRERSARPASSTTWLAHSGGHVPDASVERAEGLIHRIERERGSRVICVIHGANMEHDSFNFDDLEDVLGAIVASDTSKPLDIVLHTLGGSAFAGRQIARAVKGHRGRKTVFVPYYAMSAGTRISLAADQIVMGAHATLGPIDTQLYGWPAPSILQLLKLKPVEAISDEFLILAEEARKIVAEGRVGACDLLQVTYSHDGSCTIADEMISGKWTHGFPITAPVAKGLGLNVSTDLPDVFYDLVRCFRHSDGDNPSVLFIQR